MGGALFYQASGGALSRESDEACKKPTDLYLEIINAAVVATVTCALSDFVIALFAFLLMQGHEDIPEGEPPSEIEILERKAWKSIRRAAFWVLCVAYIFVCILIDFTFIASVTREDSVKWLISSAITLLEDFFIVPLVLGLIL